MRGLTWQGFCCRILQVGSETDGASTAPGKFKSQLMVQVPYEGGLEGAVILFRFKKRVDLL